MSPKTETEANVKESVPFFGVSNMEQSLRFYIDGLGFAMANKWIDEGKLRWCWLQHGGAAVMLQEFRKDGHGSWTREGRLGEGVSVCFTCKDALAIYREITARGVQAKRPFVGNAMWVVGVTDSDGYKLFFESPTDAPEETEFSDSR
jgi:catechol 2,3-dioxygenase-like lactoylglutathione lyase family enzyme